MTPSPENTHIHLIDRDPAMFERVASLLRSAGYRVSEVHDGRDGSPPGDALLVALDWTEADCERRTRELTTLAGGAPVLLMCPAHSVALAVRSLSLGADDYLLRPPDAHELLSRLGRILSQRELDSKVTFFQNELSKKAFYKNLEARSPAMRSVVDRILRVAPRRSTVLIFGESGVGKELVARSIHFNSPRRDAPFIPLNCAAMPANLIESELFGHERGSFTGAHARARGKFEVAHRGTLFLDEIGEMDPNTQAKLLRVLEEREFMRVGGNRSIRVDVRVIAATNANLDDLVAEGRFRQDLYYRLKVVTISVPPLRQRQQDLPRLVSTFVEELSRTNAMAPKTIPAETLAALEGYDWPGNVRELKNLLESALVSVAGDVIRPQDLPHAVRDAARRTDPEQFPPGTSLASVEREHIRRTLEQTGGNRTHSATLLGIGVRTLQRKIRAYGIEIAPTKRRRRGEIPDGGV